MSEKVSVYYLELHHPTEGKQMIRLQGETSIGSAHSNTIVLEDLAPRHCVLRLHQEVLTLFQAGESGSTKIGRQALDNSRMYILEKGDKLHFEDIKAVIKVEKEQVSELDQEDNEDSEDEIIDDDKTDNNIVTPSLSHDEDELIDDDEDQVSQKPSSFFTRLKMRFSKKKSSDNSLEDELNDEDEEAKEDEQKTDEINNAIYIPKAKVDEEDEVKKPEKKKKPYRYVNRDNMPAFFARLYAFVAEIIIAFAFVTNVVPILDLGPIYTQLHLDLAPLIQKGIDLLGPYLGEHVELLQILTSFSFIAVFTTWVVLNLFCNFIFGANLGLTLLSVRTEGTFVRARIKAVLRFLLGLVFLPLILPDLPALIKKRTLKEVLTASELSYRHFLLKIMGVLIVLPAFTLAVVTLPALLDPSIMKGPQLTKNLEVKEPKSDVIFQTHPWRVLMLALSYPQSINGEWVISPVISTLKRKPNVRVHFMRKRGETPNTITFGPIVKNSLPTEAIKKIANLDPFYHSKYPNLSTALNEGQLGEQSDEDCILLIMDALALNWDSLPHFISERGPILTPYLDLKKELLKEFNLPATGTVNAKLLGRRVFLEVSNGDKRLKIITVFKGEMVAIDLASRDGGIPAMTKFIRTFLSNAAPLKAESTPKTNESDYWTFLDFLDHYGHHKPQTLGEAAKAAVTNLTQRVLGQRTQYPWASSTLENDYRKSMNSLKELSQGQSVDWATQTFNAMNVDQALWQSQAVAPTQE